MTLFASKDEQGGCIFQLLGSPAQIGANKGGIFEKGGIFARNSVIQDYRKRDVRGGGENSAKSQF